MPQAAPLSRRWTVIGSGLLCCALALVVIYTSRSAFFSPLAVLVVAAIGLAAVLLQVKSGGKSDKIRPPTWLNICGIVLALSALFADLLHLSSQLAQILALAAIGLFGVSGAIILHAVRKQRIPSK